MAEEANEKKEVVIGSGLQSIAAALSLAGGSQEGVKNILENVKSDVVEVENEGGEGNQNNEGNEGDDNKGGEGNEAGEAGKGKDSEGAPAGDGEEGKNKEKEITNPILGKIGAKKGKQEAAKIESLDDIRTIAKTKFGLELKDNSEVNKFIESAEKWRVDASKYPEAVKRAEELEKVFTELDDVLADAIAAYHKGEDYMKVFESKPKLDFKKEVKDFKSKDLIEHYFPGKFTDEDFEAEEPGKDLELATQVAQDKFVSDQKAYNKKRADYYESQKGALKAKNDSVIGSVARLQQSFPDVAESVVADVQKALSSGDLMSLFVNKDGTFKPEAAEMIMLAKYGKQTIDDMVTFTERRVETAVNEEILTRGADGNGKVRGKSGADTTKDNVNKFLSNVGIPQPRKKTF